AGGRAAGGVCGEAAAAGLTPGQAAGPAAVAARGATAAAERRQHVQVRRQPLGTAAATGRDDGAAVRRRGCDCRRGDRRGDGRRGGSLGKRGAAGTDRPEQGGRRPTGEAAGTSVPQAVHRSLSFFRREGVSPASVSSCRMSRNRAPPGRGIRMKSWLLFYRRGDRFVFEHFADCADEIESNRQGAKDAKKKREMNSSP